MVISTDPETNFYLLQQQGKLVELWYMDSFEKLVYDDKKLKAISIVYIHKYLKSMVVKHFGPETIKEKLLPLLEESISQRVHAWSKLPALEVKSATTAVIFRFSNYYLK